MLCTVTSGCSEPKSLVPLESQFRPADSAALALAGSRKGLEKRLGGWPGPACERGTCPMLPAPGRCLRVVGSPGLWFVTLKGGLSGSPPQHFYSQVLDAPRTAFSSKHIIRRRPWASPCLFLLFLMSPSWLNCVPHQNHVSVTALAARARGCDCVWREGLKGGDEGTRSRDRPSPSVAGDLYQNRQGHRHMEGWVCGPGTVLSLGSVTGSLCPLRPGPLGWGGHPLAAPAARAALAPGPSRQNTSPSGCSLGRLIQGSAS